MKNLCVLLIFILFAYLPLRAESIGNEKRSVELKTLHAPQDTIRHGSLYEHLQALSQEFDDISFVSSKVGGDYYRLFMPLTYYSSVLDRWKVKNFLKEEPTPQQALNARLLPVDTLTFTKYARARKVTDQTLLSFYVKHHEYPMLYEEVIMSHHVPVNEINVKAPSKDPIRRLFASDPVQETSVSGNELIIRKPNFWVTGGSGSFQMSQNSISDNWYQGGESTNSLTTELRLFANYNDKKKIQFENLLEIKAGFNSVSGDTVRKYRVNTDLLRVFSKLGVQAASSWYYTITAEVKTQLFNNYKTNSKKVTSAFLAPLNFAATIGMDFKYNKKKVNMSVVMSPLAYNLRYVGDGRVNETSFGIKEGETCLHDFGSKIQTNFKWKIIPSITYDARLYYFTSYKKVEAEWENTINFILNRYLTTKLFVHARYDDSVNREPDKSYFQLKQYLSFGINYSW